MNKKCHHVLPVLSSSPPPFDDSSKSTKDEDSDEEAVVGFGKHLEEDDDEPDFHTTRIVSCYNNIGNNGIVTSQNTGFLSERNISTLSNGIPEYLDDKTLSPISQSEFSAVKSCEAVVKEENPIQFNISLDEEILNNALLSNISDEVQIRESSITSWRNPESNLVTSCEEAIFTNSAVSPVAVHSPPESEAVSACAPFTSMELINDQLQRISSHSENEYSNPGASGTNGFCFDCSFDSHEHSRLTFAERLNFPLADEINVSSEPNELHSNQPVAPYPRDKLTDFSTTKTNEPEENSLDLTAPRKEVNDVNDDEWAEFSDFASAPTIEVKKADTQKFEEDFNDFQSHSSTIAPILNTEIPLEADSFLSVLEILFSVDLLRSSTITPPNDILRIEADVFSTTQASIFWSKLKDLHETDALKFQWTTSWIRKILLQSLNMSSSNFFMEKKGTVRLNSDPKITRDILVPLKTTGFTEAMTQKEPQKATFGTANNNSHLDWANQRKLSDSGDLRIAVHSMDKSSSAPAPEGVGNQSQPSTSSMMKLTKPVSRSVMSTPGRPEDEVQAVLSRLRNLDFMHSKSLVQTNRVSKSFSKF